MSPGSSKAFRSRIPQTRPIANKQPQTCPTGRSVTSELKAESVEVERQVIEGDAADALMCAAGPGDLLVVGSGGHEVVTDLLLGSVSQRCVHHAARPVVVVHPSSPPARDDLVVQAELQSPATRAEDEEEEHDDERDRDEADREGIAEDDRLERAIGHSDDG